MGTSEAFCVAMLYLARCSLDMTRAAECNRSVSHDAAIPIACGNMVLTPLSTTPSGVPVVLSCAARCHPCNQDQAQK